MAGLLILICCITAWGATLPELREAEKAGKRFELQRALRDFKERGPEADYYRGLAEAQSGRDDEAVRRLRGALAQSGDPDLQRRIRDQLAGVFKRTGRYREAAEALAGNNDHGRLLWESLANVAAQTVEFGPQVELKAERNPLGSWDLPVALDSKKRRWMFDTGAGFSTLIESEAKELGLAIIESPGSVRGSTGKKSSLRFAVAAKLQIGRALLRNVVFLVVADEGLDVKAGPLRYQIQGILGLPVLRALRSVGISANGEVQIDSIAAARGEPNLILDGLVPIAGVFYASRRLQFFVDTGANRTSLHPATRDALTAEDLRSVTRGSETTGGLGEMLKRETDKIPLLRLEIRGQKIELKNVSLQLSGTGAYDGVLGMDALEGGFVLDFRAMQLRLLE